MINQSAGLLPHADRWSLVGMAAGLASILVLTVADVVYWFSVGGDLVARPLHGLLVVCLAALVIAGLIVQCTVRVMRWLRRLDARLARLEGEPEPGQAVDNVVAFELGRKAARAGAPTVLP